MYTILRPNTQENIPHQFVRCSSYQNSLLLYCLSYSGSVELRALERRRLPEAVCYRTTLVHQGTFSRAAAKRSASATNSEPS